MTKDYIPSADPDLREWLVNFKKSVGDMGAQAGLSPSEISTTENLCTEYITQLENTHSARLYAKGQVEAKKAMRKTHQPQLRKTIGKMKVALKEGNAKALKIMSQKSAMDKTYKPQLKLIVTGNHIEVKFKKRGISAMQLMVKIRNDIMGGEWVNLGMRMHSPAKYKPEGYPPGTVLRIWFKAVAIIKDEPFGQESDFTSVLFVVS